MCKCVVCNEEGYRINTKKFPKNFCSYKCYEEWSKFNKEPNCSCSVCGIKMYLKPSRLKRVKNGITCSQKCANLLKTQYMIGDKNHQFGLIGDLNSSFKDSDLVTNSGYLLEFCPEHPYPHDKSNNTTRVLKHRLEIERHSDLFDVLYFKVINGIKFLKPEYDVHHINENKQDNDINNLQILTRSEHTTLHNKNNNNKIGVVKSTNIGESCDANPEINSEITKGSESSYSVGDE